MMGLPLSKTRQYRILRGMKQRCYNPNCPIYKYYGAKGITVCDEWLGKQGARNFYEWSITHGYEDTLTIDRIDGKLGYSPSNCFWVEAGYNNAYDQECKTVGKLWRIMETVPTFELEYVLEHINRVTDASIKESLMKTYRSEVMKRRRRGSRQQVPRGT